MGIVCAGDRGNMMGNGAARLFAPRKSPSVPAGANPCLIGTPTPRRGCRGRAESPLLAAIGNNFAVSKSPWWGLTRRLRRGLGLAVPRGAHTFLSMAKEKCAKESQRHGDSRGGPPRFASRASSCGSPSGCPRPRFASLTRREKALYCPFLKEGVRNVARSTVG